MKIYLTDEYELKNNKIIKSKIKKVFPNVKITFLYNKKDMAKAFQKMRIERYLDEKYSNDHQEKGISDLVNYYSNIKKLQEIY